MGRELMEGYLYARSREVSIKVEWLIRCRERKWWFRREKRGNGGRVCQSMGCELDDEVKNWLQGHTYALHAKTNWILLKLVYTWRF